MSLSFKENDLFKQKGDKTARQISELYSAFLYYRLFCFLNAFMPEESTKKQDNSFLGQFRNSSDASFGIIIVFTQASCIYKNVIFPNSYFVPIMTALNPEPK